VKGWEERDYEKAETEETKKFILKSFGTLKGIRPALTPQQERKVAEEAIAEEAIKRMGGSVQYKPGQRRV
jgi:hypothetical protein